MATCQKYCNLYIKMRSQVKIKSQLVVSNVRWIPNCAIYFYKANQKRIVEPLCFGIERTKEGF